MILDWQRSGYQSAGGKGFVWSSAYAGGASTIIFNRYGSVSGPGGSASVRSMSDNVTTGGAVRSSSDGAAVK